MNHIKDLKTSLFLGVFSLFFIFYALVGPGPTRAFAQENPLAGPGPANGLTGADVENVQTTFPVRMTDVRDVGIQTAYSEKDLRSFKINFLQRFVLNFKVKFSSDPAEKLDSAFKIWADRLYRLNAAKASGPPSRKASEGRGRIARINRALEKYTKANSSFEKALSLAEATLADSEIDKILGIQNIMVKYAGFSDVIKYVLDGVKIIYEQAPNEVAKSDGLTALRMARSGFDQNLGAVESANREAERIKSDPIYQEYIKTMSSPQSTPSQKSLGTLNFFENERERSKE